MVGGFIGVIITHAYSQQKIKQKVGNDLRGDVKKKLQSQIHVWMCLYAMTRTMDRG